MSRLGIKNLGSGEGAPLSTGSFTADIRSRFQVGAATPTQDNGQNAFTQRRLTPRRSLIVVIPDDHIVSPEAVAERVVIDSKSCDTDVILACAGEPPNLGALKRKVPALQLLVAPAGTSTEDLRELAMNSAAGDIVTLLNGFATRATGDAEVAYLG
jgi:hypothetical protein